VLRILLNGGLPHPMAVEMVMGCLDGRQRTVSELLRAGATGPEAFIVTQ